MKERMIETSACDIAIVESTGTGPTVLFVHGNSSCKEVFRNQLQGAIGQTWHCVAMDLPGHGRSSDAWDPETTYNMPGYADAALRRLAEHAGLEAVHEETGLSFRELAATRV